MAEGQDHDVKNGPYKYRIVRCGASSDKYGLCEVFGIVMTTTGRAIPAPPRIRTDSNRKAAIDLKKHDEWLIQQTREEAQSRKDEFNLVWIDQMKPGRLSQSDKYLANVYLFGEECAVFTLGDQLTGGYG